MKYEEIKAIVDQYEKGLSSKATIEAIIFDRIVQQLIERPINLSMGSCCCRSHPPNETFVVKIVKQPHGYYVKRLDSIWSKMSGWLRKSTPLDMQEENNMSVLYYILCGYSFCWGISIALMMWKGRYSTLSGLERAIGLGLLSLVWPIVLLIVVGSKFKKNKTDD